jgi:TRAP-type mannitol/chloroaromatic compound transport system permease large subunit
MFVSLIVAIIFGHAPGIYPGRRRDLVRPYRQRVQHRPLFDMFANNCLGPDENYVLVAIPLFILMAQLLDRSKVSRKAF